MGFSPEMEPHLGSTPTPSSPDRTPDRVEKKKRQKKEKFHTSTDPQEGDCVDHSIAKTAKAGHVAALCLRMPACAGMRAAAHYRLVNFGELC